MMHPEVDYNPLSVSADVPPVSGLTVHRTKEETEAAHDLLELSRSLPPLPCPAPVTAQSPEGAPPTPPTQTDDHHYTTLIYITTPPGITRLTLSFITTCQQLLFQDPKLVTTCL